MQKELEKKKGAAILVFNDRGELALQLRAADDDSFPSHWDFSAGGGIDAGEDEKLSAERELQEELGIKASVALVAQERYIYPAWKPSVMREIDLWIYKAHHNGPFKPDPAEVEKVEFFTLERIKEMMESDHKFHPEFVLSWNKGVITKTLS